MVIDAEGMQDIEQCGEEGEELKENIESGSVQGEHWAATPSSRDAFSLGIARATVSSCSAPRLPPTAAWASTWLQSYSPPSVSWDLGHAELSLWAHFDVCLCALATSTAMLTGPELCLENLVCERLGFFSSS